MSQELKALVDALDLLRALHLQVCNGPRAGWIRLIHAKDHLNAQIEALLAEEVSEDD